MAGKPTSGPALTMYHLAVPLSANGDVVPIEWNHPSSEPLGTSPKPWAGFARLIEWRPRLAMTQGRRGYMQLLIASTVALPLPPQLALHPDDLAAVGPRLLIRRAEARLSGS